MQIKLRRASLAGPSERSSAAARLIANIFQGTDLVPDAVIDYARPSKLSRQSSHADRFRLLQILARDPGGKQYT